MEALRERGPAQKPGVHADVGLSNKAVVPRCSYVAATSPKPIDDVWSDVLVRE
jgi:hypothetical protein